MLPITMIIHTQLCFWQRLLGRYVSRRSCGARLSRSVVLLTLSCNANAFQSVRVGPNALSLVRLSGRSITAPEERLARTRNGSTSKIQQGKSQKTPIVNPLPKTMKAIVQDNVLLGIEPTPDIIAILIVYFVQGAIGLARLAQVFFLKDECHLSPAQSAAFGGLTVLPWILKPLYGFLSDGFPILRYRRRPYLALAGILGAIAYGVLASPRLIVDPVPAVGIFILSSLSIAVSDVVADSIVVEQIQGGQKDKKLAGGLQSLCWGSSAVGSIFSGVFSGSLLQILGTRGVFGVTAFLPLLVTLTALRINEKPFAFDYDKAIDRVVEQSKLLWSAISSKTVYLPLSFLVLWQGSPSSDSAFFYFLTNELGMQPELFGRLRLGTSIASLIGVWLYQKYLREISISKILLWTTIASVPLSLTQLILILHLNTVLGIPNEAFIFGDSIVLTVLGQLAFMPTLVLAARLCPPGIEGTFFATLMSIYNGAGALGSELGALLTQVLGVTEKDFHNLALLVIICAFSSLLPLPFLGLLGEEGERTVGRDDG